MNTTVIQGLPQGERITGTTLTLRAPGHRGSVQPLQAAGGGRSGGDRLPLDAAAALVDAAVVARTQIDLQPPPAVAAGGRSGSGGPAELVVDARGDAAYAVLQTDEAGITRWLYPAASSTPQHQVFELPAATPAAPARDGGRGEVTATMRRVVRVVSWLTAPIIGAGARALTRAWEERRRPYGLLVPAPGGTWAPAAAPPGGGSPRGPTLLLVHGTFSTPGEAFEGWVGTPAFDALATRYGSVLALAHPSLSASPAENVDWMLAALPAIGSLAGPVDIVCHSRGGLVAREIAARAAEGHLPAVARVCQVGTPNLGTPLADAEHWTEFIDAYTGALVALPDTTATVLLEGVLCLVKIVGTGVSRGLPGLAAMDPAGDALAALRAAAGGTRWFSVGASYRAGQAAQGALARLHGSAKDAALRAFFEGDNDRVVPSDGCHQPGVQVADSLRIEGGVVDHCGYFRAPDVQAALARWMS